MLAQVTNTVKVTLIGLSFTALGLLWLGLEARRAVDQDLF